MLGADVPEACFLKKRPCFGRVEQDRVVIERTPEHRKARHRIIGIVLDDAGDAAWPHDAPDFQEEIELGGGRNVMDDTTGESQIERAVLVGQSRRGAGPVGHTRIVLAGAQN